MQDFLHSTSTPAAATAKYNNHCLREGRIGRWRAAYLGKLNKTLLRPASRATNVWVREVTFCRFSATLGYIAIWWEPLKTEHFSADKSMKTWRGTSTFWGICTSNLSLPCFRPVHFLKWTNPWHLSRLNYPPWNKQQCWVWRGKKNTSSRPMTSHVEKSPRFSLKSLRRWGGKRRSSRGMTGCLGWASKPNPTPVRRWLLTVRLGSWGGPPITQHGSSPAWLFPFVVSEARSRLCLASCGG